MTRVLASLRSADLDALEDEVTALEAAGVDGFHLDVMDGRFVPEECFDPAFCARLRAMTSLLIDVHLMVERPEDWVAPYAEAGADRVSFHVEATEDPAGVLEQAARAGARGGIVCFPGTSLAALDPVLDRVAVINPLAVDPRKQLGFQEATYQRIANLVSLRERRGLDYAVQADGGVWEKTQGGLREAGADELVGGYPIFSAEDYAAAVADLRG